MTKYVVAVDVGTGSARAGVFNARGDLVSRAEMPIAIQLEDGAFAVHSSDNIWTAVVTAVATAVRDAPCAASDIVGIGFDATCSLVVLNETGGPLSVSKSRTPGWDTISWIDHRAGLETDELSAIDSEIIKHVGGRLSPEMQLPKLLWLKRHQPETWKSAGNIFDLADFLTWKASGSTKRSTSSLCAKWTYLSHRTNESGWDLPFFRQASLGDLMERAGISGPPGTVGTASGNLTDDAAAAMGLTVDCRVAFGLIDAYAGAVAMIGSFSPGRERAALIGGTSNCLLRLSKSPEFLANYWGPYYGVATPNSWLTEGGQSASGALLDHAIRMRGAGLLPIPETHQRILDRIVELRKSEPNFASELHVLPDFRGNRSPLGDPDALGAIHGLSLDLSFDGLCRVYWRCMVGIALGIRHIIDHMEVDGTKIKHLYLGGGHARNPLLVQLYADVTGVEVILSAAEDAMLLGSAMMAASAAGIYSDLASTCIAMCRQEVAVRPNASLKANYEKDYLVFKAMIRHRDEIRELVS